MLQSSLQKPSNQQVQYLSQTCFSLLKQHKLSSEVVIKISSILEKLFEIDEKLRRRNSVEQKQNQLLQDQILKRELQQMQKSYVNVKGQYQQTLEKSSTQNQRINTKIKSFQLNLRKIFENSQKFQQIINLHKLKEMMEKKIKGIQGNTSIVKTEIINYKQTLNAKYQQLQGLQNYSKNILDQSSKTFDEAEEKKQLLDYDIANLVQKQFAWTQRQEKSFKKHEGKVKQLIESKERLEKSKKVKKIVEKSRKRQEQQQESFIAPDTKVSELQIDLIKTPASKQNLFVIGILLLMASITLLVQKNIKQIG